MSGAGYGHSGTDSVIMYPEFMGFVMDDATSGIVREWVARQGWPEATVQFGGSDLFSEMLEQAAPPRLALVDVDGHGDPIGVCSRLVSLCGPATKIIVTGSANDIGFYRRMLAAGVADYLVKPLSVDHLNQAVTTVMTPVAGAGAVATEARDQKIFYVIGMRGGVGASTIALNLAWAFAQEQDINTALIDLDLHFGATALSLDIETSRGFREILSSPSRVDSLMIASSMITAGDKLTVLSTEEPLDDAAFVDGAALGAVIKEVRENFDIVVVDLPRHQFPVHRRLLATASGILLVSEQSLIGIRDTLRIKNSLKTMDITAPVFVIASRTGRDRAPQVDAATFEKGMQGKIDFVIPEDSKTLNQASIAGKAAQAIAPDSEFSRGIRKLSERIVGKGQVIAGAPKKGLLGGLLGGKK